AVCARELEWLRAEQAALRTRAQAAGRVVALPGARAAAVSAIRERARRQAHRDRAAARRSALFAALGAAAALLVAVQGIGGAPIATGAPRSDAAAAEGGE